MGSLIMSYDPSCDCILGVGSGVINDCCKVLAKALQVKQLIIGTAPSMDGYASNLSSMIQDRIKVSLYNSCPAAIICDTDIVAQAPMRMLQAGLGDMLAKYVSIAEWRIANLITGEYVCERVAQLIRTAVKKCVDNAAGLLKRDEAAVQAVFEGLVIGGVAMAYAGVSRPASGVEHYFSHVWDMRGLEFGTPVDLHGIQCAMATQKAVELYEAIKTMTPDREKAAAAVAAFDLEDWNNQLRDFLGQSGETMIAQEHKERKYDKSTHPARFEIIANNWQNILDILDEELPTAAQLCKVMDTIGISTDLNTLGVDRACARMTFKATKDIRDKYVLSRLAWDLGVLDELAGRL
jgi:glycerol-1-phosphate dehydrogenase [NAD(P)+]